MNPIELMKASAAASNKATARFTGASQCAEQRNGLKSATVARRRDAVRSLLTLDLTREEMAERLGVTTSTIKSDIAIIRAENAHADAE